MYILLAILSLSLLISIIGNKKCLSKIIRLKSRLKKSEKIIDGFVSINPGDRAVIPNMDLVYDGEERFKVTYEVEITDVSLRNVKVNAVDFTSDSKIGRKHSNRRDIISYMQDRWVDRNNVDLIISDVKRRDIKLKKLGIK